MSANPPSKATAKLTLGWGVVTIPCALYSGAEESSVQRSQFLRGTDHPVGMKSYDKVTGNDVASDQIEKRVQVDDGTWVEITDDEITQAVGDTSGLCQIIGFLPLTSLTDGTYSAEKPFQLRPAPLTIGKKSKPNPAADRAFALLLEVLRKRGWFALVNYTSRSRPRYAALTQDGQMTTLRYDEEVRAPRPLPLVDLTEQELALGEQLASSLVCAEPPVLLDTANTAVRAFAAEKKAAIDAGTPMPTPSAAPEAAAPSDLLAQLTAAVAAAQ